ncbi:DinB family protein [Pedobacter sp. ASV28]|uniref:DinB family protein n=1 Tax=Pedobacter sp. ASV28 TaxID=2795123 RepID=UPI0018EBFD99|nr:DinB family protein [Pedobacter sp. ASV28]
MARNKLIANRLREVLLNGYWIANTNYKKQLLGITWKQATQQIEDLNTIAALTYHINYYLDGILKVFDKGILQIKDKYSFDLPPINSENDWKKLVSEFLANSEKFANHIERMRDENLDQVFVDEKYGTYLRNIEAVIEHSYYHLGQISLLIKLVSARG